MKLIAVIAVVGVFSLDRRVEFAASGAVLLVIVAFVIRRIDRTDRIAAAPAPRVTLEVVPLQAPRDLDDDIEGMTVPARMSDAAAYELHERYAPTFDQQLALNRHLERHGDEHHAPDADQRAFDQHRYEQAQQYARAFDEQLAARARAPRVPAMRAQTQAYAAVTPPRRIARGSYTPGSYDQEARLAAEPTGWDPHHPPSVTGMRRVK